MVTTHPVIDEMEKKFYKDRLLYCGSAGISIPKLIQGLLRIPAEISNWDQFKERDVLPTFLGRVAGQQLCEIWQLGPGDEILMPAYNCGTEIEPFLLYGCRVVFYRVNEKAQIDVEDIIRRRTPRTKVVYVTHYFGWSQDLKELLPWCRREGLRIVEDCALALFSSGQDGPLGVQGDAGIFSLGKFFPIPAGGVLTLRRESKSTTMPMLREGTRKEVFKRIRSLLKKDFWRQLERIGLYSVLRKIKMHIPTRQIDGQSTVEFPDMPDEYYFNESFRNVGMPHLSLGLLGVMDPDQVVLQRRENYLQLEKVVKECQTPELLFANLQEGVCPLVFPIILNDRRTWARTLQRLGIGVYSWWEGYHRKCSWDEFPEARYLKDHVLCLPVNQALGVRHMAFIGQAVTALRSEMR